MFKHIIITLLGLLFALNIGGCASISSPQGGPRDSMPPRLVGSSPLPYSTSFKGKKVVLDFNEFVVLKDQQKLFFVSPEATKKATLTLKNKSVVVELKDSLKPNSTYRLDFGSSIVDNNEGNRLDDFTFTFSTGPYIDSLLMVGQALDAQTRDTIIGAFVSFFDVTQDSTYIDKGLDSTLFKSHAEVLARTDSSGYFVSDILRDKEYRTYAYLDKNGNQRYETGSDMVAFLDSTYNPTRLHGFSLQYDSIKRRTIIDSLQLSFELFTEKLVKRQTILSHNRPQANKLAFIFNAPQARFDSLTLDSIPSEWLIEERSRAGDSVALWIAPPTVEQYKALPDSIKGRMVYARQDSVMRFFDQPIKLNFFFKEKADPKAKKENDESKRKPKPGKEQDEPPIDSTQIEKPKNPFGFRVQASAELNPENHIGFTFDYPLRHVDSSRIQIVHLAEQQPKGGTRRGEQQKELKVNREPIPFTLTSDGLRQRTIKADWKYKEKYELLIPAGTFEDIAFQSNDTLLSKFTILDPDKFGTLTFITLPDSTDDGRKYILELMLRQGKENKVVKRQVDVAADDTVTFRFLAPNIYGLRIVEDKNGDKEWTTGDLRLRLPAERVRIFRKEERAELRAKENWEIVEHIDLRKLFAQ